MPVKNAVTTAARVLTSADGKRWGAYPNGDKPQFPLTVDSSGRYLRSAFGLPFLLLLDAAHSMSVQLTRAQVDTYIATRSAQGFSGFIINVLEHMFSDQTPADKNVDSGSRPFSSAGDFSTASGAYWSFIDYVVNQALAHGLAVFMVPAYVGFPATSEGWSSELAADTQAHRQAYGAFLGGRYTQPNVVWVFGGDSDDATQFSYQSDINTGLRSVLTPALTTYHGQRTGADGYAAASTLTGFNLNTIYTLKDTSDLYTDAATAYGRSGPLPFFMVESNYDEELTTTSAQELRAGFIAVMLSGGCGYAYYNHYVWNFGAANFSSGGAASAIASHLTTTGQTQIGYMLNLLKSYSWWKLVPKTDASLVTTSLGTGAARIYAAKASDSSFAMVYTRSSNFTIDMSNFAQSSVRGRWFDPTANTFATMTGSPFANSGTQALTAPGERIAVFD